MKQVLIYGDSNTYGMEQFSKGRIASDFQWPNIVAKQLEGKWRVAQQGLAGRVAGHYVDLLRVYCNGQATYQAIYKSHLPLDVVIIALGTNDFQTVYGRIASQIKDDLKWYAGASKQYSLDYNQTPPHMIYLLPTNFIDGDYFQANCSLRREVVELMRADSADCIVADDIDVGPDGVHLSLLGHKQVAEIIINKLNELEINQ